MSCYGMLSLRGRSSELGHAAKTAPAYQSAECGESWDWGGPCRSLAVTERVQRSLIYPLTLISVSSSYLSHVWPPCRPSTSDGPRRCPSPPSSSSASCCSTITAVHELFLFLDLASLARSAPSRRPPLPTPAPTRTRASAGATSPCDSPSQTSSPYRPTNRAPSPPSKPASAHPQPSNAKPSASRANPP